MAAVSWADVASAEGASADGASAVGASPDSADVGSAAEPAPPDVAPPQATAPEQPPEPLPAPQAADTPIELDGYALEGETRAPRASVDLDRPVLEGLVQLSAADGLGAGGQLRRGMFGLRGTIAYQPLKFLVDKDPGDKRFGTFQFSNSIQLNLDALLVGAESQKGVSVGYRYNDLLGHGISVAYQSMFEAWGQRFSLSFPVAYYPDATGRVRDRLDIQSNYKINFPFGAGLAFGVGVAWVL